MVSERIHPITMPRWGMTMTEGKLVGWLAAQVDFVLAQGHCYANSDIGQGRRAQADVRDS